jgi:MinD superfamily P-loop ATPase
MNDSEDYSAMFIINQQICTLCGGCASVCPEQAIIIDSQSSVITGQCSACGECAVFCPLSAIAPMPMNKSSGGQQG